MSKKKTTRFCFRNHSDAFLMTGYKSSRARMVELEQRIKNDPLHLPSRFKLLGYYFKISYSSKSAAKKQLTSVMWMIEQIPEHEVLRTPYGAIHKDSSPAVMINVNDCG